MPLIPLAVALLVIVALVLAMPLLLVQRYRLGKARRKGRRWVANMNVAAFIASTGFFIWAAALTNFWVPMAFSYSLVGILGGVMLGIIGLALTRWEETSRGSYYTPNRWLVLLLTFAVAVRMLYGIWRAWHAWHTRGHDGSWLAASGAAGSLAVGAFVLGYYLAYAAGIARRLRRGAKRVAR